MIKKGVWFLSFFLSLSLANAATYDYSSSNPMISIRDCIEGRIGGCKGFTLAPGDIVNLAPGIYEFGAIMTRGGTPTAHITIQGTSATDLAVIDLTKYEMYDAAENKLPVVNSTWGGGTGILAAHGTSTGNIDWKYAIIGVDSVGWIDFKNIEIKGAYTWNNPNNNFIGGAAAWVFWIGHGTEITMTNCKATNCQAGLWFRTADYGNRSVSDGAETIRLRNCSFTNCGLDPLQFAYSPQPYMHHPLYVESGSLDMQFCELSVRAGSGGTFINNRAVNSDIRYCYFHDNSNEMLVQNSNTMNQKDTEFEQVHTYVGNLFVLRVPDDRSWTGSWVTTQEGGGAPANGRTANHKQTLNLYYNTVVAADTQSFMGQRNLFKAERDTGSGGWYLTHDPIIRAYNNIFYNPDHTAGQIMMPYNLNHGTGNVGTITVDMNNNWITGSATDIDPTHGSCDIQANLPGCDFFSALIYGGALDPFTNRATGDFTLTATARNKANPSLGIKPAYEIYLDAGKLQSKPRLTWNDLGAYETSSCGNGMCDSGENCSTCSSDCGVCNQLIPAFPGAEGFGAYSKGGRGGRVMKVTNLDDNGQGSFRAACEASGPRIVVFNVSGHIRLATQLVINDPYITIAGQTSPGGVDVSGRPVMIQAHDVIITHMRFRMSSDVCDADDSCDVYGDPLIVMGDGSHTPYNIIIDHCSISWGCDETVDIGDWYGDAYDITLSRCLIGQGLDDPAPETHHALGVLISGKYQTSRNITVSVHHNYICHFRYRFPEVGPGAIVDIRNNVIYNWENGINTEIDHQTGYAHSLTNLVHNYYRQGLLKGMNVCGTSCTEGFFCDINDPEGKCHAQAGNAYKAVYINGNLGCGRTSQSDPDGIMMTGWSPFSFLSSSWISDTPFEMGGIPVTTTTMSASCAATIVDDAGATKPVRDSVDVQFVQDFTSGTGSVLADNHYPDKYPVFSTPAAPTDNDNDGMADSWEQSQGLNTNIDDSALDHDYNGYTNIEEYLYFLTLSNSCTIDCSGKQCGPADMNGNNVIELTELQTFITSWKQGQMTIQNVIQALTFWINGC